MKNYTSYILLSYINICKINIAELDIKEIEGDVKMMGIIKKLRINAMPGIYMYMYINMYIYI
jgi:hypothetical protein